MRQIADQVYQNETETSLGDIIGNCSSAEQRQLDSYLDSLLDLGEGELASAGSLIRTCGSLDAKKKALMVDRFEQEFTFYKDLIDMVSPELSAEELTAYQFTLWQQLLDLESQRSRLLGDFVSLQSDIVESLRAGASTESAELQQLTGEVQAKRESYSVLRSQVDEVRAQLK